MSKDLVHNVRAFYDIITNDWQRYYELKKASEDLEWKIKNKDKYIAEQSTEYDEEWKRCQTTNTVSTSLERLDNKIEQAMTTQSELRVMKQAVDKVLESQNLESTPRRTLAEMPKRAAETIDNTASTKKQLKSES